MSPTCLRRYGRDMRRTLGLATVLCMRFAGAAYAGRGGRGGGGRGRASGGVVVRDHRAGPTVVHRGGGPARNHRVPRGHVRVTNGRYMFPGGVVRVYKRPVVRTRYYDVRMRPPLIVEAYDPVPGYLWVSGGWTWGGGEWVWTPGYWSVAEAPVVTGGVSISAGISIH